jgi:hypothetical protein
MTTISSINKVLSTTVLHCSILDYLSLGDVAITRLVAKQWKGADRTDFYSNYISMKTHLSPSECTRLIEYGSLKYNTRIGEVFFHAMRNLRNLRLHRNEVMVPYLSHFPSLTTLDISHCRDIIDEAISLLSSSQFCIKELSVMECPNITNAGISPFSSSQSLNNLYISGCLGITDAGISPFSSSQFLTSLYIDKCPGITDEGISSLSLSKSLSQLFISVSGVTDAGISPFSSSRSFTSLVIYKCPGITDAGISSLSLSKSLSHLFISDCPGITDAGYDCIAKSGIRLERSKR